MDHVDREGPITQPLKWSHVEKSFYTRVIKARTQDKKRKEGEDEEFIKPKMQADNDKARHSQKRRVSLKQIVSKSGFVQTYNSIPRRKPARQRNNP